MEDADEAVKWTGEGSIPIPLPDIDASNEAQPAEKPFHSGEAAWAWLMSGLARLGHQWNILAMMMVGKLLWHTELQPNQR